MLIKIQQVIEKQLVMRVQICDYVPLPIWYIMFTSVYWLCEI
jgi:hypothetical protein